MQEYRKVKKLTPEQIIKRNIAVKKYNENKRKNDPEWVTKERARGKEYARKKRLDPEWRKKQYKRHTEWARRNKDYINEKQRERNHRDSNKLKAKAHLLKKKYGLSHDEYIYKRKLQKEKCPICKCEIGIGAVDHNHSTGQIRNILCRKCNLILGSIEKYGQLIKPMIKYLNRWNKKQTIK